MKLFFLNSHERARETRVQYAVVRVPLRVTSLSCGEEKAVTSVHRSAGRLYRRRERDDPRRRANTDVSRVPRCFAVDHDDRLAVTRRRSTGRTAVYQLPHCRCTGDHVLGEERRGAAMGADARAGNCATGPRAAREG